MFLLYNIINTLKISKQISKKRPHLSETIKKKVAASQSWNCAICKKQLSHTYQIDHKIPWHIIKSHEFSNLQALCPNCHAEKTANDLIVSLNNSKKFEIKTTLCTRCGIFISPFFNQCWKCSTVLHY
jgi:ribosomal protein S27AE